MYYIIVFIFGLIFGSFGSVLVTRLSRKLNIDIIKSIIWGRSKCPNCYNTLHSQDLIPLVTYLLQGGKCRYCDEKISSFYPVLEVLSGIVFVVSFYVANMTGLVGVDFWLFFGHIVVTNWLFLLLAVGDIKFFELNTSLWVLAFIWIILFKFLGLSGSFYLSAIGGLYFFVLFLGLYWFGKVYVQWRFGKKGLEGFGGGDVMMGFVVGLMIDIVINLHGFLASDLYMIGMLYIILSSMIGLIFGLIQLSRDNVSENSVIPFLPAMVVAYLILLVFGDYFIGIIV